MKKWITLFVLVSLGACSLNPDHGFKSAFEYHRGKWNRYEDSAHKYAVLYGSSNGYEKCYDTEYEYYDSLCAVQRDSARLYDKSFLMDADEIPADKTCYPAKP
jgi:hypothetical protein